MRPSIQLWPRTYNYYNDMTFIFFYMQITGNDIDFFLLCMWLLWYHMGVMASQITCNSAVCSRVYSNWQQRNHQGPHYWSFETGYWWLTASPHKGPVVQKAFTCPDIMGTNSVIFLLKTSWGYQTSEVQPWVPHVWTFSLETICYLYYDARVFILLTRWHILGCKYWYRHDLMSL